MKIYCITHKVIDLELPSIYQKLLVGAEGKTSDETYVRDDGNKDNISAKNKYYCELTGLYYMWKHTSDDIIGLVHYRRFFEKHGFHLTKFKPIEEKDIEKILSKYDVIVPYSLFYFKSIYKQYIKNHYKDDLDKTRAIISRMYPEYVEDYDAIMNGHRVFALNMFICKKEIIDAYSKWLFDILFALEKEIDISDRSVQQQRVYGFISERLFDVYLRHHHYSYKNVYVCRTQIGPIRASLEYLSLGLLNLKKGHKF